MNGIDEKLKGKIEELHSKLLSEENPLKLGIYISRLEFLLLKAEKQLEIKRMEENQQKVEEVTVDEVQEEDKLNSDKLKRQKIYYSEKLKKDSIYDPGSTDFMFEERLENVDGNIDLLIDELKRENNFEDANKLEEIYGIRQAYDKIDIELNKYQKNYNNSQATIKTNEEKQMIKAKDKINIFELIFKAIKKGWRIFRRSKKITNKAKKDIEGYENKEENFEDLREEKNAILEKSVDAYRKIEEIYNVCESQELEALNQQYKKKKAEIYKYKIGKKRKIEKINKWYEAVRNEVEKKYETNNNENKETLISSNQKAQEDYDKKVKERIEQKKKEIDSKKSKDIRELYSCDDEITKRVMEITKNFNDKNINSEMKTSADDVEQK